MPAPKASSGGSRGSSRSKSGGGRSRKKPEHARADARSTGEANAGTQAKPAAAVADSLMSFAEQLVNRVIRPLDMVLLTRERIQETVDEAAARGRVTRSDANELVAELVRRGREQTDDIFGDIEQLLGRGRDQLGSVARRTRITDPLDLLARGTDRARRSAGQNAPLPISGYDELTAGQVAERLAGLSPAQLRKLREYERRHANRKSVLASIDRRL
jgi:polyhydroxyalkanoate synthesis regulator phasin